MDSGNSGSISSSGDEEYDSRPDQTILPSTFLNQTPQFGSISSHPQSSLLSSHNHHSLFDLSSTYLHAFSQTQPNSNPNSFLNLDTGSRRSEHNCTDTTAGGGGGVSSSSASAINHCLLAPPLHHPQGLGQCVTDPSLQLRSVHDDNNNARVALSSSTNVVRNPKKRTRASRRAPTTVLTTDTSNFRAMVQEFTGIPAPPFSGSSYSRRLDLLTGSSSLRSSVSHQLDITSPFYPLGPSPQKVQPHHHHHQNPLLLSSSPPSPSTTLLHNNNMVDAIASTTNISSSSAANNSSSNNNNNSINYQLPPPDLGLPYNHHTHNIMLSMQNHPILTFHPPPPLLHPFGNHVSAGGGGGGFSAKSQSSLSVPSLEDLQGVSQGQVNAHLVGSGVSVPTVHHVTNSEGMPLRGSSDYGGKVASAGGGGGSCKMNFSGSGSSNLNRIEKTNLENNNNNSTRGEGAVDSWICSSD